MVIDFRQKNIYFLNQQVTIVKNYLEDANNLMNGVYKLQKGLDEINFNKTLDWNYKHSISSNTYQLYLHTLNFNNSLVKAFIQKNDIRYIIKAKLIIEDWIKENLNQKETKNYAWYDHTVSSRIQNLLYYQSNAPNKYKIKKKKFAKVFKKHLDFLVKYKNYTENNHGIMMDRALVIGSLFLEDAELRNDYIMLAKNRIEKAILRDYSYKSVHLENSPDYHRMVTNWLNKAIKLFDDIKMPLSSKYKNILKGADIYNGIIANYNKEYPMIGDTAFGTTNVKKQHTDFIDYEAGVGVFNNRNTQSTLVFNCGFKNLTHKHKDDLSFTLSVEKEEIFVDSGKYNYNKNDPIRKYMISPVAHTTLFVQNKDYLLTNHNVINIMTSHIDKDYKLIKGIHKGYKDITLERSIIVLNSGAYIIIDKAYSKIENTYVQNFLLSHKVTMKVIGTRKYLLTTKNKKEYILQEHSKIAASKTLTGKNENSMISPEFNVIKDTSRIEIRKKQRNSSLLTTITPKEQKINILLFQDDKLSIVVNDEKFNIKL